MANIKKEEGPVIEIEGLVQVLRDAWAEMLRSGNVKVA
jgi:flagellin-specific chaperone FliS